MSGSAPPPRPPRMAVRLLEWALPPTNRGASIIGDLHEEFEQRASRGLARARLWYVCEAVGVARRYAGARSRQTGRSSSTGMTERSLGWEGMVDRLQTNVRYAVRRLLKSPVFTLVAVLSLGLGIGANTAMFSLVNAVIIRDMPFAEPERLIDVYEASLGFTHGAVSYPDYIDLAASTGDVFEAVGGLQLALLQADTDTGVELLFAEAVTGNYFDLLGVRPALGRLVSGEDDVAPGAHPVVVLSHDYWVSRFGADPSAVGSELRLGRRPYTIIGVAPEAFPGSLRGLEPDVFVPILMYDELEGLGGDITQARGNQSFFGKARLRPEATLAQAEAAAERVSRTLREEHPTQWTAQRAFVLAPTADVILNPMIDRFIVPAAGMIMAVVGMVLLIACANLASFLLARAADRRKEIAVRLAMGARRRTLIGQLLTETVILSGLGGLAGVLLAIEALRALQAADLPLPLPIALDLSLDRTVLGFSLLISLGAGVLFGLAPALQSTSPDLAPTLRDETAGGGRARGGRLRDLLVVGQVAVSVVLLIGAGLFLRSLEASRSIDPGFGSEPTALLTLTLPADRYEDEAGLQYLETLVGRARELPGLASVGVVDNLPLNQLNTQFVRVRVDGVEPPVGEVAHLVDFAMIDDTYLDAAGIVMVAGRGFDRTDGADTEAVALVNREFERSFFPDGGAVGRTIVVNDVDRQVVGVTADHKVRNLGEAPRSFLYVSNRQRFSNSVTVVARTGGDAERLALDLMRLARELDPEVMVIETETMRRHLAVMLVGRELGALVVGGFALLALLLASIGLYGVVSYAVARRVREVGIRLSLGADAGEMTRMLTRGGMRLVALGGVVGLLVSAAASQLLSRLLYGVPALDPVTFLVVPIVLGTVALFASWIPARRVTRIDPVRALRAE